MTRALVCGDRNWKDRDYILMRLDAMQELYGITEIIEGCARGADRAAEIWVATRLGMQTSLGDDRLSLRHFPAEWNKYGKAAGVIRNQQMLDEGRPDMVIAFHTALMQSKGTKDMVERAQKAGIMTFVFPHHE